MYVCMYVGTGALLRSDGEGLQTTRIFLMELAAPPAYKQRWGQRARPMGMYEPRQPYIPMGQTNGTGRRTS